MQSILLETTATHNGTSSAAEEQNLVQYCSALLCLDSYAISFMIILEQNQQTSSNSTCNSSLQAL